MEDSRKVAIHRQNVAGMLVTLRAALMVLPVCLALYIGLIVVLTVVRISGEPLIVRILPISQTTGQGFSQARLEEARKQSSVDLLFTGPSQAYRTFDTNEFQKRGTSAFNLGTTAQTPLNSYFLVQSLVDQLKPKRVVLVVSQHGLAMDGLESASDLVANLPMNPHLFRMALAVGHPTATNLAVAATVRDFFGPELALPSLRNAADTYQPGGFVETHRQFESNQRFVSTSIHLSEDQMGWLVRCIRFLRSRGMDVVAVSTPILRSTFDSISNYQENHQRLMRLFAVEDVPYRDLNMEMERLGDDRFFDEVHLNRIGANEVSREVSKWLTSIDAMNQQNPHE
jgi:hypothetical protein